MLRIDLREVRAGGVETTGQLAADDQLLADAGLVLSGPVRIAGRLSPAGEGRLLWRAHMETVARFECRRCLAPVDVAVSQSLDLMFVEGDAALHDDACYAIPSRSTVLDLREAVREELVLALPRFVECRSDCRGLCPRCGANLNAGPCGCAATADPRWDALRALLPRDADAE